MTASTSTAGNRLGVKLADVACRAALSVGEPLRAAFRSHMDIGYKRDLHDLVTEHDKQTEAALRAFIMDEVPDSTFVGEEGGRSGAGTVHWYVDPIDGTSNFAAGIAFWCVSIGAVIDEEIVAGIVFDPVSGNVFAADCNGATLNDRPLHSHAAAEEKRATLITGFPTARDLREDGKQQALDDFAALAESFATLRRPGSAALSICHVAAGWSDAAAGFSVNPWDVAAAILILRRAGGEYRPLAFGGAPDCGAAHMCPGYVATGQGATYPALQAIADGIAARRGHNA